MTDPDYEQTLDDIRAALMAICKAITANVNISGYGLYKQADFPYWTISMPRTAPSIEGTGEFKLSETILLVCHMGHLTEESKVEEAAQRTKTLATIEFLRRPFLQSTEYPRGVAAVDSDGAFPRDISIVRGGTETTQSLNVTVTLDVPLLLQFDELNFEEG